MMNAEIAIELERLSGQLADVVAEMDRQRDADAVFYTHYNWETVRELRELAGSLMTSEKMWEIWCEGHSVTGNSTGATLLSTQLASTFDEAVSLYIKTAEDSSLFSRSNDCWTFWGCRLFDNEQDARKSFG